MSPLKGRRVKMMLEKPTALGLYPTHKVPFFSCDTRKVIWIKNRKNPRHFEKKNTHYYVRGKTLVSVFVF
jgi:hypothetical protein